MISYHSNQYEENPSTHHGGMHEDRLTDGWMEWTLSYIPQFYLGGAWNQNKDRQSTGVIAWGGGVYWNPPSLGF